MANVLNLLTVDCEEWFVAEALADRLDRSEWDSLQTTVARNCERLLDMFYKYRVSATWFMLGWVAERHKDLLQMIVNEGHEIACHSYSHRRVDQLTPEQFREDTQRAVDAIMRAIGNRPFGYRAPSWSINETTPWAFEILTELGFEYDSSIFPIKHDFYGVPQGPRQTFKIRAANGGTLHEIPASTYRVLGQNIPIAGGGYFRHIPYWYTRSMIRSLNRRGQLVMTYIHPWELDPSPPTLGGLSAMQRLRTYGSTSILARKFERLLGDFEFTTMYGYLSDFKRRRIGFQ